MQCVRVCSSDREDALIGATDHFTRSSARQHLGVQTQAVCRNNTSQDPVPFLPPHKQKQSISLLPLPPCTSFGSWTIDKCSTISTEWGWSLDLRTLILATRSSPFTKHQTKKNELYVHCYQDKHVIIITKPLNIATCVPTIHHTMPRCHDRSLQDSSLYEEGVEKARSGQSGTCVPTNLG